MQMKIQLCLFSKHLSKLMLLDDYQYKIARLLCNLQYIFFNSCKLHHNTSQEALVLASKTMCMKYDLNFRISVMITPFLVSSPFPGYILCKRELKFQYKNCVGCPFNTNHKQIFILFILN